MGFSQSGSVKRRAGEGTMTFDRVAIASSVAEFMVVAVLIVGLT